MAQTVRNCLLCLSIFMMVTLGVITKGNTVSAAPIQRGADPGGPFSRRDRPSQPEIEMENARKRALKKEQYESLKKDTDQLLALATELKQDVDKTTENTLSLDVIKKTEEVEKLAKKVREKMKGY